MILSLDLGAKLGWAFGRDKILDHGVIHLSSPWGHKQASEFFRIVLNFRDKFKITKVLCEKVGGRFYNSNVALLGMSGVLQLVYNDHIVEQYSPKTIKKYWTGNGNADKSHMVMITRMYYPDVMDDNESDAIAIWHYGTKETYDIFED